jgi:hypothetical protein
MDMDCNYCRRLEVTPQMIQVGVDALAARYFDLMDSYGSPRSFELCSRPWWQRSKNLNAGRARNFLPIDPCSSALVQN